MRKIADIFGLFKHSNHSLWNNHPLLIILVFAIFAEICFLLLSRDADLFSRARVAPDVTRQYWQDKINALGSKQAYEELKDENKSVSFEEQHQVAHLFGEFLYKKDGIDGIAVCDSSFSFGCYHSFFSAAISREGEGVVEKLNTACIEKYGIGGTGCQHGIGHGLMEYFGPQKLSDALSYCDKIQKFQLLGCSSGAFMEYNFPVLIGDEETVVETRSFEAGQPHWPCTAVSLEFQPSCFFELPDLLSNIYGQNYQSVASVCDDIVDSTSRIACFRGIGNAIASKKDYQIEDIILSCEQMGSKDDMLYCRAGAAWAFFAMPAYQAQASRLCEGLNTQGEHRCNELIDLTREPLRKNET